MSLSKNPPVVDHFFSKTKKLPIKIVLTSSLSSDGYLFKVVSFLFGSPVSDSTVSKPIFGIKVTKDKTNISTPMLSGSGKNVLSFGSLYASASPNSCGGFFECLVISPHPLRAIQAKML